MKSGVREFPLPTQNSTAAGIPIDARLPQLSRVHAVHRAAVMPSAVVAALRRTRSPKRMTLEKPGHLPIRSLAMLGDVYSMLPVLNPCF